MLEKIIKASVTTISLAAALSGCATTNEDYQGIDRGNLTRAVMGKELIQEVNPETGLRPNMYGEILPPKTYEKYDNGSFCAGYAVTLSRDRYGKNMRFRDAWDIAYGNKVVSKIEDEDHLNNLVESKVLTPGMIIAVKYGSSGYLKGKNDMKGNPRKYTHLATFVGVDDEGLPVFQHQFKGREETVDWDDLKSLNSKPIEIIDER